MILSDDVSDDDSIDDGTECNGDYVETREGDSESAEDATSGMIIPLAPEFPFKFYHTLYLKCQ